jgi:diguanylate cyclase (GGDEF)-like protein/PAS domain S-box-containing protein
MQELEDQRLGALESYRILDTESERDYDGITALAAHICGMPVAVISFHDRERLWFKARVGTELREKSREASITELVLRAEGVTIIPDTHNDPRLAHLYRGDTPNPLRFYAAAPLATADGLILGALIVGDLAPRSLAADQCRALETLAQQVMIQLQLRKQNTSLLETMHALRREQELSAQLVRHSPIGIVIFDEEGTCITVNDTIAGLLDSPRHALIGRNFHRVEALKTCGIYPQGLHTLQTGTAATGTFRHRSENGTELWVRVKFCALPTALGRRLVLMVDDISDIKRAEANAYKLAYIDALTGLPNRSLLIDHIQAAIEVARRKESFGAVLFIDLDNFKRIVNARGPSVGDQILATLSGRILDTLRPGDMVARIGGDEFVVLLADLAGDRDTAARMAMSAAEKVRRILERPCEIGENAYRCTGSIGVTMFPKASEGVDDLLREADTAMYRAKDAGRNRIAFFETRMQAEVQERLSLEEDLKQALSGGQLCVYCQTQVDASGRETGGELLLRWTHPIRGTIAPSVFIPIAEESGIIHELGEWVIRQACDALVRLDGASPQLHIAVNISPRQFRHDLFVARVSRILAETGAPADRLVFEVTEGLLIDKWETVAARMEELNRMGIRFSIDDFGTGYSSLAYLRRLPLHEVKIDRSFVRDTPQNPQDTAIVQSIISIARHLKLHVVAEGVERAEQAALLIDCACDCMQGFLFGAPEPIEGWLLRRGATPPKAEAANAS